MPSSVCAAPAIVSPSTRTPSAITRVEGGSRTSDVSGISIASIYFPWSAAGSNSSFALSARGAAKTTCPGMFTACGARASGPTFIPGFALPASLVPAFFAAPLSLLPVPSAAAGCAERNCASSIRASVTCSINLSLSGCVRSTRSNSRTVRSKKSGAATCACIRVDISIAAARSVCISAAVIFPPTPCATACSSESDRAVCHAAIPDLSLGGLVKKCGASLPAIFAGSSKRFAPCHANVAANVVASATTARRTYVGAGANALLRLSQRRSRPLGVSQIPNPILSPLPPCTVNHSRPARAPARTLPPSPGPKIQSGTRTDCSAFEFVAPISTFRTAVFELGLAFDVIAAGSGSSNRAGVEPVSYRARRHAPPTNRAGSVSRIHHARNSPDRDGRQIHAFRDAARYRPSAPVPLAATAETRIAPAASRQPPQNRPTRPGPAELPRGEHVPQIRAVLVPNVTAPILPLRFQRGESALCLPRTLTLPRRRPRSLRHRPAQRHVPELTALPQPRAQPRALLPQSH